MRRIALISALFLSGCASPQEIAMQKQMLAQQDSATCQSYGFEPGGEGFANCRLQLELARQQRESYATAYPYTPPPPYAYWRH
ncbi:MAG: hypothetical protein KGJ06_04335 [Pseudomonadota bacterium]|nr:hypothetical protein [Pseudomonadota bacterium]